MCCHFPVENHAWAKKIKCMSLSALNLLKTGFETYKAKFFKVCVAISLLNLLKTMLELKKIKCMSLSALNLLKTGFETYKAKNFKVCVAISLLNLLKTMLELKKNKVYVAFCVEFVENWIWDHLLVSTVIDHL